MTKCFSTNPIFSEARRSFFLITIFDFSFMVLLWLIYCTTKGYSLKQAYENEIVHYDINVSLFDVVALSIVKFLFLAIFYVFMRFIHWLPVSMITFGSSTFLIAKVVLFAIEGSHKIITDYVILIVSFVITWIQVWYLEVKIFAPERDQQYTQLQETPQNHHHTHHSINNVERGYGSLNRRAISDIGSFYSPLDSPNASDDEENRNNNNLNLQLPKRPSSLILPDLSNLSINTQAKEYDTLANDLIKKVMEIYNHQDGWKLDKQIVDDNSQFTASTQQSATEIRIYTKSFIKIGKVFKLEGYINSNENLVVSVLRDRVEEYPIWNKSVKAAKFLCRYSESLAIIYSSVHEQASGLVASRDFVNLTKHIKVEDIHVLAGSACTHPNMPPQDGYVRGENGPTAYIIKPIDDNKCHVTWILNVNLKGWLPQYLIDQSLSSVQLEFISSLREHLNNLSKTNQLV